MSGPYTLPCQRCGIKPAMSLRVSTRAGYLFSAATGRADTEVRLCHSCERTVESLSYAVARAKTRRRS